jgi:hypothetical protein
MAGSMKTSGTEELIAMLGRLGNEAPRIAAYALYEGAGVVADAYKSAVGSIMTTSRRRHKEPGGRLPTKEEKAMLQGATGVSKFHKDIDSVDTLVGAAEGYGSLNGRRKAYKLLARSINSGIHFMKKQPVFRRASSQSRAKAQAAMVAKAEELINEIAK